MSKDHASTRELLREAPRVVDMAVEDVEGYQKDMGIYADFVVRVPRDIRKLIKSVAKGDSTRRGAKDLFAKEVETLFHKRGYDNISVQYKRTYVHFIVKWLPEAAEEAA